MVKALLAYKKGEMGEAIRLGRRAVDLATSGDSLMWLAYFYLQAGRIDAGRETADAAVACNPQSWESGWGRAMVALFSGDAENAAPGPKEGSAAVPSE